MRLFNFSNLSVGKRKRRQIDPILAELETNHPLHLEACCHLFFRDGSLNISAFPAEALWSNMPRANRKRSSAESGRDGGWSCNSTAATVLIRQTSNSILFRRTGIIVIRTYNIKNNFIVALPCYKTHPWTMRSLYWKRGSGLNEQFENYFNDYNGNFIPRNQEFVEISFIVLQFKKMSNSIRL